MNTKNFKKRFHCSGIAEKIRIANMVGECVSKEQMPTGRAMTYEEYELISSLCEWCNQNIFFDVMPAMLSAKDQMDFVKQMNK
jgi:hypothetical protein